MYQKYPSFLAPQTEIPLTGEMSQSDKRGDCEVRAARTCDRSEILSCNCPWSGRCTLYFFLLTAPLFLPPAAGHGEPVNSHSSLTIEAYSVFISSARFSNLWCGVTAQKSDKPKRSTHALRKCFFLAPQTVIPLTGEMSRSDKRVIARNKQLEPVDGVAAQKII